MSRLLSSPLTYIIAGLFLLSFGLFALSMFQLRQARRLPYWRIRKTAGQRGGQLFLISISLFVGTCVLAFFSGFAAVALGEFNDLIYGPKETRFPGIALPTMTFTPNYPTPDVEGTVGAILTATGQAAAVLSTPTWTEQPSTETRTPTESPMPTATVTPTVTRTPTITASPTETRTPTPTFEFVLDLTPPASTVQPRRGAAVAIISVSDHVPADGTVPESQDSFANGIQRIYIFFGYKEMDTGITWSRVLYREGVPVQGGAYQWGLGEEGQSFFFFGHEKGYPPGQYEIRLFLGIAEVSRFRFVVMA